MPAFYQSGENVSDLVNTGKLPLSTYFRSGFALLKELCDHGYTTGSARWSREKPETT